MKKYLFLLILPLLMIFPKDVFAIQPTTDGYSCYYNSNGSSSCGDLTTRTIDSEYTISPNFSVNDKTDTWWKYNSIVIDLYNQDFCTDVSGGGTWRTWLFFNLPINNMVDVTVSYGNLVLSTVQTNNNDGYGLTLDIIIPQSFEDGTITISIEANTDIPLDPSYPLYLGLSTYTDDTQTCQLSTGDVINSQNSNTNTIINNNNENTQNIIDNFNTTINDTFTNCELSKNLFNGQIETGKYNTVGVKTTDSTTIRNVDFISVEPNTNYIFSNNGSGIGVNLYQYDKDYNFLSYQLVNSGNSFTTSSDTYYLNFYKGSSNADKIQLEEGSTISMYEVYGENCTNKLDDIISSNKETQETIEEQFNSCKNYDFSGTENIGIDNKYLNGSGQYVSSENWAVSSYTYVEKNKTYILDFDWADSTKYYCLYDKNKKLISCNNYIGLPISIIPSEDGYIRYDILKGDYDVTFTGEACINRIDEMNETNKGIWETIKDLPNAFLNMLKGLFIPEDFSFLDEFKDSLSNKLGFIAEIPLSILDFLFSLASAGWEEFNSITFPSIEIFGVYFWNEMEIDLTEAKRIFEPFKYLTDLGCVIICVNTLRRWYDAFASGGGN